MGRPKRPRYLITDRLWLEDKQRAFLEIIARECPQVLKSLRDQVLDGGVSVRTWCMRFGVQDSWIEDSAELTVKLWRDDPRTLEATDTASVELAMAKVRELRDSKSLGLIDWWLWPNVQRLDPGFEGTPQPDGIIYSDLERHALSALCFVPAYRLRPQRELFAFSQRVDPLDAAGLFQTWDEFKKNMHGLMEAELNKYQEYLQQAGLVHEAEEMSEVQLKMRCAVLATFGGLNSEEILEQVRPGMQSATRVNAGIREVVALLGLPARGVGRQWPKVKTA